VHETEVHVQLLVAVEKRQTRVVCDEIELDLLKPTHHHDVLNDPGGRLVVGVLGVSIGMWIVQAYITGPGPLP
jgi:hypothetical protein